MTPISPSSSLPASPPSLSEGSIRLQKAWIQWCSLIWKGGATEDFPEMDQGWVQWLRDIGLSQFQQVLLTPASKLHVPCKKNTDASSAPAAPAPSASSATPPNRPLATLLHTTPLPGTVDLNEAVLLIPPCSHKASIFNIQPEKSMVNELVRAGYHVITLEWHAPSLASPDTPDKKDFLPCWADYRTTLLEIFQKLHDAYQSVHLIGLCLGGIMALDALTAPQPKPTFTGSIRSLTLLASLLDYRTPGPLSCMQWPPLYSALRQQLDKLALIPAGLIYSACCALLPAPPPSPSPLSQWSQNGLNVSAPLARELLEAFYIRNFLIEPDPATGTSPLNRLKTPLYAVGGLNDRLVPIQGLVNGLHACSPQLPIRLSLFEAGHLRCFLPGQAHKGYQGNWKGESLEQWLIQAQASASGGWMSDWSEWTKTLPL